MRAATTAKSPLAQVACCRFLTAAKSGLGQEFVTLRTDILKSPENRTRIKQHDRSCSLAPGLTAFEPLSRDRRGQRDACATRFDSSPRAIIGPIALAGR